MRHNNPDIYDIESDAPDRREFFFFETLLWRCSRRGFCMKAGAIKKRL
jgi:hypothetical protein